jgi:hypothetical protein
MVYLLLNDAMALLRLFNQTKKLSLGYVYITFIQHNREYCRRDPSCWPCGTLYLQKLVLTSPKRRSLGRYSSAGLYGMKVWTSCITYAVKMLCNKCLCSRHLFESTHQHQHLHMAQILFHTHTKPLVPSLHNPSSDPLLSVVMHKDNIHVVPPITYKDTGALPLNTYSYPIPSTSCYC